MRHSSNMVWSNELAHYCGPNRVTHYGLCPMGWTTEGPFSGLILRPLAKSQTMMPRYGMDTRGTLHGYSIDMDFTYKMWSIEYGMTRYIAYSELFGYHRSQIWQNRENSQNWIGCPSLMGWPSLFITREITTLEWFTKDKFPFSSRIQNPKVYKLGTTTMGPCYNIKPPLKLMVGNPLATICLWRIHDDSLVIL